MKNNKALILLTIICLAMIFVSCTPMHAANIIENEVDFELNLNDEKVPTEDEYDGNETIEIPTEDELRARKYILNRFGIVDEEYSILRMEHDFSRGGFLKAEIQSQEDVFELFYDWGWCSSGGSNCGWIIKFKSKSYESNLYDSVKEKLCNKIYVGYNNEEGTCPDEAADFNQKFRDLCMDGMFEDLTKSSRTISINQTMDRCTSDVKVGDMNIY